MIRTDSTRRAFLASFRGHPSPVMCSFEASPDPNATQKRPSYMADSVDAACAMIAGW